MSSELDDNLPFQIPDQLKLNDTQLVNSTGIVMASVEKPTDSETGIEEMPAATISPPTEHTTAPTSVHGIEVTPGSSLSCCQKAALPLASLGLAIVYGSLLAQPVVFISIFGTNPSLVGGINVGMVFYDLVVTPYFGKLSDEGRLNIWCFQDLKRWGRRAPMGFMSLPMLALGFWCNWVGPENFNDQVALGLWFLMVRVLLSTSLGGMFINANLSAFTELFPGRKERGTMAALRGIGFATGTFIGAGLMTTAAISMEDDAGSPEQRKLYLSLAIFSMLCILMMAPWCYVMSKSVMVEATNTESMITVARNVWASGTPVKVLSLALLIQQSAAFIVLTLITFFLRQCFGFTQKQAGLGQSLVIGMVSLTFLIGFPVGGFLTRRFHPINVLAISIFSTDALYVACTVLALLVKGNPGLVLLLLSIGIGLKGVPAAFILVGRQILVGWVVDEDQVTRSARVRETDGTVAASCVVRRDGAFNSFVACAVALGRLSIGVCQVLLGLAGYEADRDADNIPQPESVKYLLIVLYLVVYPILSTVQWVILWYYFPIKGDRLERVEKEYAALFTLKTVMKSNSRSSPDEQRVAKSHQEALTANEES